jgi:hypothetical protein
MSMTREEWLEAGVRHLRINFDAAGHTLPPVKVSCSWPGGGSARKRIGECWPTKMSAAKVNEIFISPMVADPVQALDILVHELCHAVDDCASGHKAPFVRIARSVGLEGKPTATHAGEALKISLQCIAKAIGEYPHRRLDLSGRKKQTTRNLKHECPECGATWRMAAKWGKPIACPVCAHDLTEESNDE